MRLTDLNPGWLSHGGDAMTRNGQPVPLRERIGVAFDCPCGQCGVRIAILFRNPPDGQGAIDGHSWEREGDTFETLTLRPSILRTPPRGCGWHGYVTAGEIRSA